MKLTVEQILDRIDAIIKADSQDSAIKAVRSKPLQTGIDKLIKAAAQKSYGSKQPISREHVRTMVEEHLIENYQKPAIIDAVTKVIWQSYKKNI